MRRWGALVTLVGAIAAGALTSPGAAASPTTVSAHSLAAYTTPVVAVSEGEPLEFANADAVGLSHNVTEDVQPAADARFASPTIGAGQTAPVAGVESLPAGSYGFFCTLHPWMEGRLQVLPAGVVPATPPPVEVVDPAVTPVVALPGGVVPTPTAVEVHGSHLYAASFGQQAVVRMPILPGGVLGAPEPVATGLTSPLGVVVASDGTVFVSDSHPGGPAYGGRTVGRVRAVTPGGSHEIVVDGLPNGRHNTNNLALRAGRLYITNGNATDDGINGGSPELPLSGTLVSVAGTARGIVVGPDGAAVAGLTVEATGMRNNYDVAFRPGTDEAWMTVNGPDTFDPFGEDTLVKVPDVGGPAPDFGFPECLYRADGAVLDNPVTPGTCGPHTPPEQLLGLHASADGLAFGPAAPPWDGDLFVAEFGNFFGLERGHVAGHRVSRVPIDAAGRAGPPQGFVLGVAPLDLAFGPDGLYVADFATGQITLFRGVA